MTAVFVHGVPETAEIWDPLIHELGRTDCVTLQLPGFGCDPPDEFQPTMDGYAAWTAEEIAPLDEVDLVGHDWGGLLALRVAADNPPNLRTWCVDSPDVTPGFEWHESARGWQTPQRGEAIAQWLAGGPDHERLEVVVGLGVPRRFADRVIAHIDARMTSSMLQLYRSAQDIGSSWGSRLDTIEASGARSAPFGHTTVPSSGSTTTLAKYSTSRRGSNIGPLGPASRSARSTPPTKPSAKVSLELSSGGRRVHRLSRRGTAS